MVLVIVKIFFYKKTSSVQVSSFKSLKNFFGNQGKIKVFFIPNSKLGADFGADFVF